MSPVTGVILLTMYQEMVEVRSRIESGRGWNSPWHSSVTSVTSVVQAFRRRLNRTCPGHEISHIRKALLFVDDQILDNRQILRVSLLYQMRGSIAIRPRIVHVDMHVAAHPLRRLVRNIRPQLDTKAGSLALGDFHAPPLKP